MSGCERGQAEEAAVRADTASAAAEAAGIPQIDTEVCASAKEYPEAALSNLRRAIGDCDEAALRRITAGRHEAICALEDMAKDAGRFREAAGLLLRLAATEDRKEAYSAACVFSRLFANMPPDQAPPPAEVDDRVALLAELLDGDDGRRRLLALDACDTALDSVKAEQGDCKKRGLSGPIFYSKPSIKEVGPHRKFLRMVLDRVANMEQGERQRAIDIVAERAAELSRIGGMRDEAFGAVRLLCEKRPEDRAYVAKAAKAALDESRPCPWSDAARDAWKKFIDDVSNDAQVSA